MFDHLNSPSLLLVHYHIHLSSIHHQNSHFFITKNLVNITHLNQTLHTTTITHYLLHLRSPITDSIDRAFIPTPHYSHPLFAIYQ